MHRGRVSIRKQTRRLVGIRLCRLGQHDEFTTPVARGQVAVICVRCCRQTALVQAVHRSA